VTRLSLEQNPVPVRDFIRLALDLEEASSQKEVDDKDKVSAHSSRQQGPRLTLR
jgi:hypothetical protein